MRFEREGSQVAIHADSDTMLLVLTGEPLDEPVFGYGPFVMTNEGGNPPGDRRFQRRPFRRGGRMIE